MNSKRRFKKTREEMYQGLMKLVEQKRVGKKGLIEAIGEWKEKEDCCPWNKAN